MGFTGATLTVLAIDLGAPPAGKADRVRPALVIGAAAAVALVVVLVAVLWPRKPREPDPYAQQAAARPTRGRSRRPSRPETPRPWPAARSTRRSPSPSRTSPSPAPSSPASRPTPSRSCRPTRSPRATTCSGSPATGPGTTRRNDFLWVSGFWRDVPPGRRWVPGTGRRSRAAGSGSPGFWAADQAEQVSYVPPPAADRSTPARPCRRPQADRRLRPRLLGVARDALPLAARLLGRLPARLGLGAGPLRLDARRLRLRRRLLGPPAGAAAACSSPRCASSRRAVGRLGLHARASSSRTDFLLTALFVGPARHHYYFGDYFTDGLRRARLRGLVRLPPDAASYDAILQPLSRTLPRRPGWERNLRELYRGRFAATCRGRRTPMCEQQKVVQSFTVSKTTNVNVIKNVNFTHVQNVTAVTPLARVARAHDAPFGPGVGRRVEPAHPVKTHQLGGGARGREAANPTFPAGRPGAAPRSPADRRGHGSRQARSPRPKVGRWWCRKCRPPGRRPR